MVEKLLSEYFLAKGIVSPDKIETVLAAQGTTRAKLGVIAVSEKLMTVEQADEVNKLQSVMDKRFGDIAVEKGYLTDDQVSRLLGLQGNGYLSFVQLITDNNVLTLKEVEDAVAAYQSENSFTNTDMEAIKSDDVDRIVPLFLPQDLDENQKEHILVGIRTIIRLIDNKAYIGKAYKANEKKVDAFALQSLDGDKKASLAIVGDVVKLAGKFADDTFDKVDLDALDAVAEFINCVNGMFATKSVGKLNVDMLPPSYKDEATSLKGDMIVIPVTYMDESIEIISTFGDIINY